MERQGSGGVTTECLPVTGCPLTEGDRLPRVRTPLSQPLRYDLTRRSMTDE